MTSPKTYEDWLALSDSEREEVKQSWNAYLRDVSVEGSMRWPSMRFWST